MKIREEDATAPVSLERDVLPDSPGKRCHVPGIRNPLRFVRTISRGFIQEDRAERLRRSLHAQLRRI